MTPQTTLTDDAPLIVDFTCSFEHEGRTKRYPAFASLRMDVRREVGPDIVADARFVPLRSRIVKKGYCDPPHMFSNGKSKENLENLQAYRRRRGHRALDSFTRYYWWTSKAQWFDFVEKTNAEFARVLDPEEGLLFYKITDTKSKATTNSEDLKAMTNFSIIEDVETASIPFANTVHWLTMKPKRSVEPLDIGSVDTTP